MEFRYLLSLGSNLGNRQAHLMQGVQLLSCEVQVRQVSRIMETIPLSHPGYETADHASYLNCVVDCATDKSADELYDRVIRPIEDLVGHSREAKWRPRELDIDVLFGAHNEHEFFHHCAQLRLSTPDGFIVPHSDVWSRPFLLELIERDLKVDKQSLCRQSSW